MKLLSFLFYKSVVVKKKRVIFESRNLFFDNSYYFYKYLKTQKYQCYYICEDMHQYNSRKLYGVPKKRIVWDPACNYIKQKSRFTKKIYAIYFSYISLSCKHLIFSYFLVRSFFFGVPTKL